MKNVDQLFRLLIEVIFILVGVFLLWVGIAGRYLFYPRSPSWLIISGALVLWGLQGWWNGRKAAKPRWRTAEKIGGASLALAGLIMLSLAWAPFRLAGLLLAAAGCVFVLRGLVTAALMVRAS